MPPNQNAFTVIPRTSSILQIVHTSLCNLGCTFDWFNPKEAEGLQDSALDTSREGLAECEASFMLYPILQTPLPNHPFIVHTESSNVGLGVSLVQDTPWGEQPKLRRAEQNCTTIEKEALAMKWAVDSFHYFLWRQVFTIMPHCSGYTI